MLGLTFAMGVGVSLVTGLVAEPSHAFEFRCDPQPGNGYCGMRGN